MANVVRVATVVTKMEAVAHKKRVWTHHFANKDLNNVKVGNIAYFFI